METQNIYWKKITLFCFFIVSFLGLMMRYRLVFQDSFFEQHNLLESHSHFAFYGWISQTIYFFLYQYLSSLLPEKKLKKYKFLLVVNLVFSFIALLAFAYGGYYWLSIMISSFLLMISFFYFFSILKDLKGLKNIEKKWFLAGLFFALFSSVGVLSLGIVKAKYHGILDLYHACIYFYLHFQYNGFFIFSLIGFFISWMKKKGVVISEKQNHFIFTLMFVACFLAYGLSLIGYGLPLSIVSLIGIGSVLQILATYVLMKLIYFNRCIIFFQMPLAMRLLLMGIGSIFCVKSILQMILNIPQVGTELVLYRTVIIAYLHLVLLMMISGFLVFKIMEELKVKTKMQQYAIVFFMLAIGLNQILLVTDGFLSMNGKSIPYGTKILLFVSFLISMSILSLFFSIRKNIKS